MIYLLTGMEKDSVKSSLEALEIKLACKRMLIKKIKNLKLEILSPVWKELKELKYRNRLQCNF